MGTRTVLLVPAGTISGSVMGCQSPVSRSVQLSRLVLAARVGQESSAPPAVDRTLKRSGPPWMK
jgi:hypothetical protein